MYPSPVIAHDQLEFQKCKLHHMRVVPCPTPPGCAKYKQGISTANSQHLVCMLHSPLLWTLSMSLHLRHLAHADLSH